MTPFHPAFFLLAKSGLKPKPIQLLFCLKMKCFVSCIESVSFQIISIFLKKLIASHVMFLMFPMILKRAKPSFVQQPWLRIVLAAFTGACTVALWCGLVGLPVSLRTVVSRWHPISWPVSVSTSATEGHSVGQRAAWACSRAPCPFCKAVYVSQETHVISPLLGWPPAGERRGENISQ